MRQKRILQIVSYFMVIVSIINLIIDIQNILIIGKSLSSNLVNGIVSATIAHVAPLIQSGLMLTSGILGINYYKKPTQNTSCIIIGYLALLAAIASTILSFVNFNLTPMYIIEIVLIITLPIIYTYNSYKLFPLA